MKYRNWEISELGNIGTIPKFHAWNMGIVVLKMLCEQTITWWETFVLSNEYIHLQETFCSVPKSPKETAWFRNFMILIFHTTPGHTARVVLTRPHLDFFLHFPKTGHATLKQRARWGHKNRIYIPGQCNLLARHGPDASTRRARCGRTPRLCSTVGALWPFSWSSTPQGWTRRVSWTSQRKETSVFVWDSALWLSPSPCVYPPAPLLMGRKERFDWRHQTGKTVCGRPATCVDIQAYTHGHRHTHTHKDSLRVTSWRASHGDPHRHKTHLLCQKWPQKLKVRLTRELVWNSTMSQFSKPKRVHILFSGNYLKTDSTTLLRLIQGPGDNK